MSEISAKFYEDWKARNCIGYDDVVDVPMLLDEFLSAAGSAPDAKAIRDAALEEAARVADSHMHCRLDENCANSIQNEIRSLKSTKQSSDARRG